MRGGCRIFRKLYSKMDIENLIEDYKNSNNKLYSPITKKVYKNLLAWKTSIYYNLDKPSTNYFFYLLESPRFSLYSNKQLTEEEFSYSETYKGWTGWKKYTLEEIQKRVWMKTRKGKQNCNISKGLQIFYSTPEGKKVRKLQNEKSMISLKRFWKTPEGILNRQQASKKISIIMKDKIRNGTFTPNITNSFTHWNATVNCNNRKVSFRSSWEACFFLSNPKLKYEVLRIGYIDEKHNNRTCIVDFYDEQNKIAYELKPTTFFRKQVKKMNVVIDYCLKNDIKFVWINEFNIKDYIKIDNISLENRAQYDKMIKGIQ